MNLPSDPTADAPLQTTPTRHRIAEGASQAASAHASAIRLRAGPARLGVITVAAERVVTLALEPGVAATIGGQAIAQGGLAFTDEATTRVRFGTASFIVIGTRGNLVLRGRGSGAAPGGTTVPVRLSFGGGACRVGG